jgi:hypothetical protein
MPSRWKRTLLKILRSPALDTRTALKPLLSSVLGLLRESLFLVLTSTVLKKAHHPMTFMVSRKYLFLIISNTLKGSVVGLFPKVHFPRDRPISPNKLLILEQKYLTLE